MGMRCYDCGEKFGRCYEHGGACPPGCDFGSHACPGDWEGGYSNGDFIQEVRMVPAPPDNTDF